MPPTCPQCANTRIHFSYPGIEEIYRRLLEALPASDVSLLSKEKIHTRPLQRIVIGTLYALPYLDWKKIQSVIVLDTDISLDFPDFRSSEWLLSRLQSMYASLQNNKATFFIITKHPHHPTLQAFEKHIPQEWYADELKDRKKLNFPPFSVLIKLTHSDASKQTGKEKVKQTCNDLNVFFSKKKLSASIIPIDSIPERSQSGFHFSILIRLKQFNDEFLSELYDICGSEWNIKINPLDLFS